MGIQNFCKLFDCIYPPTTNLHSFDSILFDAQSLLYTSIYYAFQKDEKDFVQEVCQSTWEQIKKTLNQLLDSDQFNRSHLTLVVSFDGVGVPMKWPTQRQRRSAFNRECLSGKKLYQVSLFGVNTISLKVQRYVVRQLKHFSLDGIEQLTMIVSGCNVPGEGEHKLFHIAEHWKEDGRLCCRKPVVVSVDQDVFMIALMRMDRYESLQIFRYNKVYYLTRQALLQSKEDYPWNRFIIVSFLFGNDFSPCLIPISDTNGPSIHTALLKSRNFIGSEEDTPDDLSPDFTTTHFENEEPPWVMYRFLNEMHGKIKYERVAYVDNTLLEQFWTVYFWMSDYYTKSDFPQKHMENLYYDRFDRNQILTGLTTLHFSQEAYAAAETQYANVKTEECLDHVSAVFLDSDIRQLLERFWPKLPQRDTSCEVIRTFGSFA